MKTNYEIFCNIRKDAALLLEKIYELYIIGEFINKDVLLKEMSLSSSRLFIIYKYIKDLKLIESVNLMNDNFIIRSITPKGIDIYEDKIKFDKFKKGIK